MLDSDDTKIPLKEKVSSHKEGLFSNIYSVITSALAIIAFGFAVGYWVASVEHKNNLLQKEIEYQKQIVSEREKWEDKHKEESKLDQIVNMLSAVEISNKE